MPETKTTKARSTRKTAVKKEASESAEVTSLKSALASLHLRVEALESKCARLEKAKATNNSGGALSDERWEKLKLYLEKKFGRDMLKTTGLWEI